MILLLPALALFQTAPAQTAAMPQWTFTERANAETGARSATAAIRSEDGNARLIVRCDVVKEPIISVQFIPKPPIPAGASKIITLTFDDARAEMAPWEFPGAGAYVGEPSQAWFLVAGIVAAKKIEVGFNGDDGAPIGNVFKGPRDDALFRKVYAACGFPYAQPPVTAAK